MHDSLTLEPCLRSMSWSMAAEDLAQHLGSPTSVRRPCAYAYGHGVLGKGLKGISCN